MLGLAGLMHRKSTDKLSKWPCETSDHNKSPLTAPKILRNNGKSNVDLASHRVYVIALSVYLHQRDVSQLRHSGGNGVLAHLHLLVY